MPLLVDTWNVLHVVGVLPPDLAGIDLVGLAALIEGSRYAGEDVELVCDGRDPGDPTPTAGRIRVTWSNGPEADDVIRERISRSTAPRRLTVVSSDRAILAAGRRRRCRLLTSPQFLRELAEDAERRAAPATRGGEGRRPGPKPVLPADVLAEARRIEEQAAEASRRATEEALKAQRAAKIEEEQAELAAEARRKALEPDPDSLLIELEPESPGGATLPPDVIAEAERLLEEEQDP